MSEFFELISGTLESYLTTYSGDMPDEESQETQFILALCGIVTSKLSLGHLACLVTHKIQLHPSHTLVFLYFSVSLDIAASPYGRDYLANGVEGRALIDILCSVLASSPNGQPW